MNIYLYKEYNNYYNRIVKNHETVDGYEDWFCCGVQNVNFSPNDYETTTHVIDHPLAGSCDYFIAENEDGEIDSRWFIIEAVRKRYNQWQLTLKRDLLADYWEQIKQSKAYIYKGHVDYGNPLIWNSEGMSLNQIKQKEHILRGSFYGNYTPWVVGYVASNVQKKDYEISVEYTGYDYLGFGPFSSIITGTGEFRVVFNRDVKIQLGCYMTNPSYTIYKNDYYNPYTDEYYREQINIGTNNCIEFDSRFGFGNWGNPSQLLITSLKSSIENDFQRGQIVDALMQENDEIICYNDDKYYRITLIDTIEESFEKSNLGLSLANNYSPNGIFNGHYNVIYKTRVLKVEELGGGYGTTTSETFKIDPAVELPNTGAPYKIFCIPMEEFKDFTSGKIIKQENVLPQALAISKALGSELYDLQIVPYCPLINAEYTRSEPEKRLGIECDISSYIRTSSNEIKGVVYWTSSITTSGILEIPDDIKYKINANSKIDNETLMYRIVSPNYNGTFEFSPVKNNGLDYFIYDQTLKPYSPHIHVHPNFGGLYKQNFEDARGLICGGDFSLPRITDQFAEYELNNKNYQLQFDRQIESMELEQKWGIAEGVVNASLGGVVGVGLGGAKYGPFGAAVGVGAGVVEGALNLIEKINLGQDKINAAKDQFNWNLQNIKARPYNLTNIGVLNYDFKYFPFLEIYDATSVEKQMVADKIKYEGMTLNVIGTIADYYNNYDGYLRCQIIRIEGIPEDYNLVNAINNELMKGVYLQDV